VTQRGGSRLAAALALIAAFGCAPKQDETAAQLRARAPQASPAVRRFYESRGFAPAWRDAGDRRSLLEALAQAPTHGLDPRAYGLDRLGSSDSSDDRALGAKAIAPRDLAFTQSFFDYAATLAHGRIRKPKPADDPQLVPVLEWALAHHDVANALEALAPRQPGYQALREALQGYRAIGADPWPALATDDATGDALRKRLAAEGLGDLRAFQQRRGLPPTGSIDAETLRVLSITPQERTKQIEANLERWRRLPRDLGKRYIWVNLADFTLAAYDAGAQVLRMRVIVGSQYNPTPIFFDRMAYLIFNPYWLIPPTIARDEILPKGRQYMEREGIKTDAQGRLRQEPGPKNPLGRIKFMFPNQFDVYLHDTSKAELFERQDRTLSHGCVRVEKPVDLAAFVLGGELSRERIVAAIESGENKRVDVADPVPVYILYWTAWVDSDGSVEFRDDVYGYDQALEQELTVEASRGAAAAQSS